MAGRKRETRLDMSFFDEVDGWRGFIADDPGMTFDGVDVVNGEDGTEITKAYGKSADGEIEEYTPQMRAKIEARVAAKTPQFRGEEAA